jgi:hypothetical protein
MNDAIKAMLDPVRIVMYGRRTVIPILYSLRRDYPLVTM